MPQPTRLYLVRHGQSAGNAEGRFGGHGTTPLSPLGVEQAEKTAKILAKEGINVIYSSDLFRAVQTAEPLAKLTGLTIKTSDAFRVRRPSSPAGAADGIEWADPHFGDHCGCFA